MDFITNQSRTIDLNKIACMKVYKPREPRPDPNCFPNCHEIRIYFDVVHESSGVWDTAFGQLVYTDADECTRQVRKLRQMVVQL